MEQHAVKRVVVVERQAQNGRRGNATTAMEARRWPWELAAIKLETLGRRKLRTEVISASRDCVRGS